MTASINAIVASCAGFTSPPSKQDGQLDVDELLSAIAPILRSQIRDDVQLALDQMKAGLEAAYARQHQQICGAVWERLWPTLRIIEAIRQHLPVAIDSILDENFPPAEPADAPESDGPAIQS